MGFKSKKDEFSNSNISFTIPKHLTIGLIYLLVYRIIADVTLNFMNVKSGPSTVATLFFPAVGVTIAFLLYFDIWIIPLIPINIFYETITNNRPEFVVLWLPIIVTIGYGGCGVILKKILKVDPSFKTLRDGLYYILVTVGCSLFVGFTYSFVRAVNNPKTAPTLVTFGFDFFIGDIAGVLSLTPFLTVILFPALKKIIFKEFDYSKLNNYLKNFFIILISTVIWTVIIFSQNFYTPDKILFLFVIPLVTIAILTGIRGSILANVLIILEVVITLQFKGVDNIFEFQVAIVSLSSVALIIGVVISERQDYLSKVEDLVHDRTLKLEEANQNLEFFSYSVSHDLRAPLTNINASISLILEDYDNNIDSNIREILTRMKSNSDRMDVLTTDLLNFFKLSQQEIKKEQIDMSKIINQAYSSISQIFNEVTIGLDIQPDLPNCLGDSSLLYVVWTNLLSNAVKYSSKKDKAFIKIGSILNNDNRITYFIQDNGVGFDMKDQSRLFKVFQRLHNDIEFSGTGIGLAIVKKIVNQHGGKIWAESPGQNRGATFFFTLK